MRVLGALGVICGCALAGFAHANELRSRLVCISALIEALHYMAAELKAQSLPIPELISRLSEESPAEVRGFFASLAEGMPHLGEESFESIWMRVVTDDISLKLGREERAILVGIGGYIGKFSAEEQAVMLEGAQARLEERRNFAAEKSREGARLYPGLGISAGLMLSAVFL